MNNFLVHKTVASRPSDEGDPNSHKVKQFPVANAAVGMVAAGLGAAAAAGIGPIVLPAVVVGGLAAYMLTNKIPAE